MGKKWYRLVEDRPQHRVVMLISLTAQQAAKYPGMLEPVEWEPDERLLALMKEGDIERISSLRAEVPVGRFDE